MHDVLARIENDYDPQRRLYGQKAHTPGYHSRLPDGTWAHFTRENLAIASRLLASDDSACVERACGVIEAVLAHQDTDPLNPTYGIWPWAVEEPLAEMAPPDWNWADFCGALLADMLIFHPRKLPASLAGRMGEAVGHAAWSIFRRNVGPGYTNIAIMGVGVTAAAGELLDEPRLLDYGRRRIARFLEYTHHHGGLNEYNSPCYTFVALHEVERILALVRDPATRGAAESLRLFIWESLAEHFHPPTGQLAGPHSRSYADLLSGDTAAYLAAQTGAKILHAARGEPQPPSYGAHLPCPEKLRKRFVQQPQEELSVDTRFIRREPDHRSTRGFTWMNQRGCLGSVTFDTLWTQRRPLIGYWRQDGDTVAVLRLRFLKDGKDFASAAVRTFQRGSRALATVFLVTDQGDFHCHLDRPSDGVFSAADLRLRLEVTAAGASVNTRGDGLYELHASPLKVVVHALPAIFDGRPARWETGEKNGHVWLDAVCHTGSEIKLLPAKLQETAMGFGMELLDEAQTAFAASPTFEHTATAATLAWSQLSPDAQLVAPLRPAPLADCL